MDECLRTGKVPKLNDKKSEFDNDDPNDEKVV